MSMRFIIWDPREGDPPRTSDGDFNTSGLIGWLEINNVYLRTYAVWPDGFSADSLKALGVGQCVRGVMWRLGDTKGTYDVYRVE